MNAANVIHTPFCNATLMKEKYKLLEFEILEKAVAGDFTAMEKVIAYFNRYMIFWAKHNGVVNYAYHEEMRAKLIKAVKEFKFDR